MAQQQATNIAAAYPDRDATLAKNRRREAVERAVQLTLLAAASVSILTTLGILASLLGETFAFFRRVSIVEFVTGTVWTPLFSQKEFGIWALLSATLLTSAIALLVAVPLGLLAAIYLSEFAPPRVRNVVKPALEVLAGIPTIVLGFFALFFVSGYLQRLIPGLEFQNSLCAGLVMGIAIIPLVSSLSEDAMSAVPSGLREGAYGLGSTRFEVATKVVFPAALSGIGASIILALSRAIGETMIVSIAAGQRPIYTWDPRVAVETMTAFIVQVSLGDTPAGSLEYQTIFAVGTTLFVITFAMNAFSFWFVRRFREVYD